MRFSPRRPSGRLLRPTWEVIRQLFFALGNVLAGIGSNLLANRIQDWKDEADAAQKIAAEAPYNPDLRTELDVVLERLEALPLARQALSEDEHQWFADTLREELDRMGNLGKFKAMLSGSGAISQGPGAAAAGAE